MKYINLIVIFFLAFFNNSIANTKFSLQDWVTHSSLIDVSSVSVDSKGRIWVGSSGGVFVYDRSLDKIKEFRNIDALLSLDITVISCNPNEKVIYTGASDGVIDIISEDFGFTHITDIRTANFTNSKITDIVFRDSIVYISGGFGLALFNNNQKVFILTADRLGKFQQYTEVNKTKIINNEIWLATKLGIAKANLNSYLADPQSWINYTKTDGLPSDNVSDIIKFNDEIYFSTDKNICKFQNDSIEIGRAHV